MLQFILVFIGGGVGSLCRWGISRGLQPFLLKFPWATFFSNALACLVLGMLLGARMKSGLSMEKHLLLVTGFCGGFSTFSTFTAETIQLLQNGQYGSAALNIAGNLVVSMACLLAGIKLGCV